MDPYCQLTLLLLLGIAADARSQVIGEKNQNATTNNGLMIQNNVTVRPAVEKSLRSTAKAQLGDDRGWQRILTPSSDPTPQNTCHFAPNTLQVYLGGGHAGACSADVCKVLVDNNPNADTKTLLEVERKKRLLLISAVVFDEDGKVVAAISDNLPHVNKNNAFDWSRIDDHTFDVVDQKNRHVLHIRYLNKDAIYIEGTFLTR